MEVIYGFYHSLSKLSEVRHITNSYGIWREWNEEIRRYLIEYKLAKVRQDIQRNKRLAEIELNDVTEDISLQTCDVQEKQLQLVVDQMSPEELAQRVYKVRNRLATEENRLDDRLRTNGIEKLNEETNDAK